MITSECHFIPSCPIYTSISKDTSFKGAWFITPACSFGCLYEMWIPMNEILEAGREDDLDLTEADFGKR